MFLRGIRVGNIGSKRYYLVQYRVQEVRYTIVLVTERSVCCFSHFYNVEFADMSYCEILQVKYMKLTITDNKKKPVKTSE